MPGIAEAIDGAVTTVYNPALFPWLLRRDLPAPVAPPPQLPPLAHTHPLTEVTGLVALLGLYELRSHKDRDNGYAGLGPDGLLPGTRQTYGTTAATAMEGNDERVVSPGRLLCAYGRVLVGNHHALWGPDR